jgi:leader peptidase (prepilin peptidase)/N-methyltransferase
VSWFLDTALAGGAVGAVAAAFVPRLVARLPEPPPEVDDEIPAAANEAEFARPVDAPKELYVDVAALPGLAWKSAVACGLAAAAIGGRIGWHPALLFLLYLVPVCVALTVVDWRTRYLPKALVGPSYAVVAVLAVLAAALTSDWGALEVSAVGWLGAYAFFLVLCLLPGGMGYGDVRLAGVLGMALGWLGVPQLVLGLYTGFLLGGVVGLVLSRLRVFHHRHSPFGPHMVIGAFLAVVVPTQLTAAYGAVIGGITSLVAR